MNCASWWDEWLFPLIVHRANLQEFVNLKKDKDLQIRLLAVMKLLYILTVVRIPSSSYLLEERYRFECVKSL